MAIRAAECECALLASEQLYFDQADVLGQLGLMPAT
jgi:hypothetical protein